jgi:hypothetical protein
MSSKKMFLLGATLFGLLIFSFVSVGFSLVLWTKAYGGEGEQSATSIIQTSDGGFAIFGNTKESVDSGDNYFLLVKIDANGTMTWNQTYKRGESDVARSVVQTHDGGYALVGQTFSSFDTGSSDFWLVKVDTTGNVEWNNTYGQWYMDDPCSVVETSDGGFALFGTTLSIVGNLEDYLLVKTDSYGNMLWNKTYGTSDREYGSSMVETSDGGYALAGSIMSSNSNYTGAYELLKIDSMGNLQWNQRYGWNKLIGIKYSFTVNDLVITSDGGFALGGTTRAYSTDYSDKFLLVKTDGLGNMQWNQTYREGGGPLIATSDGGFAFAGSYRNEDTFLDVWLIKTGMTGTLEWNQNYSLADRQEVSSLIQTSDSGFALAGRTADLDDENSDFWVLKTDEYGIPEFPLWAILPLLLVGTLFVVFFKKRLPFKKVDV